MKDRRIGKFSINQHIIDECPHQVLAIMKDMIIIRAEFMWHSNEVEYTGVHPAFAVKPDGHEPRKYYPALTTRGDGAVLKVEWKTW